MPVIRAQNSVCSDQFQFKSVLGIRIHMFLGLPDPDPLVRGMDPDDVNVPPKSNKQKIKKNSFLLAS